MTNRRQIPIDTPETARLMVRLKGQAAGDILVAIWAHAERMERERDGIFRELELTEKLVGMLKRVIRQMLARGSA